MPLLTPHVPGGLIDLMKNLAKEVLRDKPENIYEFAAVYFEKLIQQRDGSLDKDYEQFVAFQTNFDGQQRFAVPANFGYTCQRPIKIQPILHTKKSKSDMLAGFKAMESINEEDVLTETPYSNEKYQKAIYVIQRYYRRYMAQKKNQSSTTLTATTAAIIIQRTMRRLFANKIKLKTNDEDTAKHDGVVQDDEDVDNVSEAASYTSSSTIQMLADSQEGRENRLAGREVALSDVSGAADDDGSTGFKEQTTVTQDAAPIIPPPSTTESSEADGKSIAAENGNIGSIHQEETTPNHPTPAHDDVNDTSTAHIGKLSAIIGSNDQQNSLHTHTVEIDSNSSDPTQIITPVVAVGKSPQSLGASPNALPSTSPRPHREEHFAVHLRGNAYAENSAANPYQSVAHIRKFDPNTGESLKTYDAFSQDRDDPDFSDSLNESTMERDSLENEDLDVDSLESNESVTHGSGGIAKREVDQDYAELYGNTSEVPEQEKQDVHQSVQLERAPTYLYGIHPSRTPIAERKSKKSRNQSAESTKARDTKDLATTVSIGIDDRTPEDRSEEESLESKGSTSEESSVTQIENVSDAAHNTDKEATDGDDLKSYEGALIKIDEVDGVPSGSLQKETSSAGNALAMNPGEEATSQTDDILKHGREFSIGKDDSLNDTMTPVDGGKRNVACKGVLRESTQMDSERFSQKPVSGKPEIHKSDNVILQLAAGKDLSEDITVENEDALSSKKTTSRLVESLVAEVEDPGRLQKPSVSPLPGHSSQPAAAIEDAVQTGSEASLDRSDDRLKEASVSGISDRASDKYNTEKQPREEGLTVEAKDLFETQKILVSDRGSIDTKDGSDVHQSTILEKIETTDDQAKTTTRRHKRSLHDANLEHADKSDQEPSLALKSVSNSDDKLNIEASSKSVASATYDHPTNKHDLKVEKQVENSSLSAPLGYFVTLYSDQSTGGTMSSIPDNHDQQVESQLRELQSLTDLYPGLEIKDVISEFHTRDIQPDDRGIDEDFAHDDNNNVDAYELGKSEGIPKDQKPSEEREALIEDSRIVGEKTEGEGEAGHMDQPKGLHESPKEMKVIQMNNSNIGKAREEPKMEKDEVSNEDGDISRTIQTESLSGLNKPLIGDSLERHQKSQKMSKGLLELESNRNGKDDKSNTDETIDDNVKGNISPTDRKEDKIENSGANMAKPEIKYEISKPAKEENLNTLTPVTSSSRLADKNHKAIKRDELKPRSTTIPEPKIIEEDYFGSTIDRNIQANDNPVIDILKADGVTLKAAGSKLPKLEEEPHEFVRDSFPIFDSVSEKTADRLFREDKLNLTDAKTDTNLEVSLIPESRLEPEKDEKGDNLATREQKLVENELTSSKMPNQDDSLALINLEKHPLTGMQPSADSEMSKLSESDVEYLKNKTTLPDELKNDEDNIKEGKTTNDTVGEASMAFKSDSFDIEDKYSIQNELTSDENLKPNDILALKKSEKHASTSSIEPRAGSGMLKLSEHLEDKTGLSNVLQSYKDNIKEGRSENDTEGKNKMTGGSDILSTEEKYGDENENDNEGKNKMADRSDILNTEPKYSDENANDTEGKNKIAEKSDILNTEQKYSDENENDTEGKNKMADRSDILNTEPKYRDENANDTEGKNKIADKSDILNTEQKYSDENENDTKGKNKMADRSDILNTEQKYSDENENDTEGKNKMADRSDILNTEQKYNDENENDTKGKNKMADRSDILNTEQKYSDENENDTEVKNKMADRYDILNTEQKYSDENENDTEGINKMADRSDILNTEQKYSDENENDTEGKNKMADRSDIINTEPKYSYENENDAEGKNKMADRTDILNTEQKYSDENENDTEGKNKMADRSDILNTEQKYSGENENDTKGKNKMADRSDILNTEPKYRDENESMSSKIPKREDSLASTKAEEHASTVIEPAPRLEKSKLLDSGVEYLEHRTRLNDDLKSDEGNVRSHKSNENQGPISKRNEGENREMCSGDNDDLIATNDTLEASKAISIAETDKKNFIDKELMSNKSMTNDNHSARSKSEQLSLTDTQITDTSITPELSKIDVESPHDISSTKLRNLGPSKSPALTDDVQRMGEDSISKRGENENEENDDSTEETSNINENLDQMKVLRIGNDQLVGNLPTSSKFVKGDSSDVKPTYQGLEIIGKPFSVQRTAADDDSSESVKVEELRPHKNDSAGLKSVSESSKEPKSIDLERENETPLPTNPKVEINFKPPSLQDLSLESKLEVLGLTSKSASLEDKTVLGKKDGLGVTHSEISLEVDRNITVEQLEETFVSKDPLIKLGLEHVSLEVNASLNNSVRAVEGNISDSSLTNIKPSSMEKTLKDTGGKNKTALEVSIGEVSIVSPHIEGERSGIAETNSQEETKVTNLPKLDVEPQVGGDQIEAVVEAIGKPELDNSIEGSTPSQVGIEKQIEDVKESKDKRLETDILPNDYVEIKQADNSSIEQLNSAPSSVSLPTDVTSCDESNAETSADFSSIGKDLDFFEDTIHYLKSATAQLTIVDDIFTEDEKKRQSGEALIDNVADADSEITPTPGDALYQVKQESINQKENRSPVIEGLETAKADAFDQAATVIQSAVRGYRVRRDLSSKQSGTLSVGDQQSNIYKPTKDSSDFEENIIGNHSPIEHISSDEPASKEASKSEIKNKETESKALKQISEQFDSKTKNPTKPVYTASHPAPPRIAHEKSIQKLEKSVKSDTSIIPSNESHKIKSSITREKPIERKSKPIKSESLDETKTSVKSNNFDKGQLESQPGRTKIPMPGKQKTAAKPLKDESDKPKSKILKSKVPSTSNLLDRDRSAKSKRTQLGRNVRSVSVKQQNQKVNVFDLEAIKNDLLSTKKVTSSKNFSVRPKMPQQKSNSPIKLSMVSDSAKQSKNSIDKSKLAKGNVQTKEQKISREESSDKIVVNDPKLPAVKSDLEIFSDELQSVTKAATTVESLKGNIDSSHQISATTIQKTFRGYRTRKHLKSVSATEQSKNPELTAVTEGNLNIVNAKDGTDHVQKQADTETNKNSNESHTSVIFDTLKKDVEDFKNTALDKSATKIQKTFRGFRTRKTLKGDNESVEMLGRMLTPDETDIFNRAVKSGSISGKTHQSGEMMDQREKGQDNFVKLKDRFEEANKEALNKSATTIQKNFRGYKTRKNLKNAKSFESISDKTFTIRSTSKEVGDTLINDNITCIGTTEESLDKVQIVSAKIGKNPNKEKESASSTIFENLKRDMDSFKNAALDKSAIKIQKTFRGYKTRKALKDDLSKINTNVLGGKEISDEIVNKKSTNILNDDGKTLARESESKWKAKDNNLHIGILDNSQSDAEESPALDEFATKIQKTFRGYKTRKEMMAQLSNSGTKSDEILTSSQPQSGKSESERVGQLQKLTKNASNAHGMKKSKSAEEIAVNDISEKAAITIQKTFKGFKARKELKTDGKFKKGIATEQLLSKNSVNSQITSNSEDAESLSEATTKIDTENSTNSEREYLKRDETALDDPAESFSLIKTTTRAASAGALLGAAASTIQKAFRDYHSRKESTLHKTKSYSHGAQRDNTHKETIDTSDESSTFIGPDTSFDLSDIDSVGTKSTLTLEMEISNPPSFALSIHSEGHDIENDVANATLVRENSLSVSPQRILRKRSIIIEATAPLLADIVNAGESTDSNGKPQWYVGEDRIVPSTDTGPSTFQNPLASSSSFDKSSSIDSRNDSFISNLQPTPSINSAVVSTSSLLFDTKDTEMHDTIKNTPKHLNKHSRAVSADEGEKRAGKETEIKNEVNNCQEVDKADEKTEKQSVDEEDVFEENGASPHGLTDLAESLMLTSTDPFSPRNATEDVKDDSLAIVTELCKNCADGVHEVHDEDVTMTSSGGKLPASELSDETENRAVKPGDSKDITQSTSKHFDEIKQFVLMEEEPKTTKRNYENNESKKVNETNGNDTETSAMKNVPEQGDNQMSNVISDDGQCGLPLVTVDQVNSNGNDTNVGPLIALIPASSEEETSDRESKDEFEKISHSGKNGKHGENNVTTAGKEKSPSEVDDSNESEKSYSGKQQSVDIFQATLPVRGDEVKEINIVGECDKVAVVSTDSPSKTKPSGSEDALKDSIKEETKIEVDSTETEKILNELTEKSEDILDESTAVKSHESNLDGGLNLRDIEADKNPATKPTKDSQNDIEERNQNVTILPEETTKSIELDIDVEAATVGETKSKATTELFGTEDAENVNTKQKSRTIDSEASGENVSIDKYNEDSPELSSNIVHPLDIAENLEDKLEKKTNEDQKFEDNFNETCTDKIAVEDPIKVIQESRLSSEVSEDKIAASTLHESLKIDEKNSAYSENGDSKVSKSKSSSDTTKEENEVHADVGFLEESKLKRAESCHNDDSSNEKFDEEDDSKRDSNTGEVKKGANDIEPKALSEEGEVQYKSQDEIPCQEKSASESGNGNIVSTLEEHKQLPKEPESLLTDGIHQQSSENADFKAAEKEDPEVMSEDRSADLEKSVDHSEDANKVDIKIKSNADFKAAEKEDPEVKSEDHSVDLEKSVGHTEDSGKVDIITNSDADLKEAAEKRDPEVKSEELSADLEKSVGDTEDPGKVDIDPKSSKEGAATTAEHKVIDSKEDLEIASKLLEGCLPKTDHSKGSDKQPSEDDESANFTTDVKPSSEDVKSEQNSPERLSLSDDSLTVQANLEKLIDESVRQIENDINPINQQDLPIENSAHEVVEVPCIKKVLPPTPLSATSDQDESELESTTTKAESTTTSPGYDGASDNDALDIPPSLPDSLEAMAAKLRETEEMVARMHQRRASEHKISVEIADQLPAFEDRVSEPIRPMRELQKSSSTEVEDDIILQKLQRGNTTRESSAQSESVVFGDSTSQLTESEDTFNEGPDVKALHRMNTIAVDRNSYKPSNLLQKSVTIDDTVKYIDPEKSTEESGGSFCLDDVISADVRKKIMAYSISEADSDYYDAGERTARLHDDFNISTALDTFPSSDTDTTIVTAATKIQAGARGFLTRRKIRRASMGTKSSLNEETKTSFGNDAIGESLDRLVEEEDDKRKSKVQYHRQVGVNSLPSALGNSTEIETPSREQVHAGDDSDDLNLAAKLTSVAEEINATPHGECSSIDGQRENRNDVNGGQETDDESAQVPPNLEAALAARRLTLQRGDAMRNDSTPDDDNGNTKQVDPAKSIPATAAGTMLIHQTAMVDSTTMGTTPAETTTTTTMTTNTERRNYSDAAMTIKMDKVKWFAMRQNSMPVQIDSEVFRVLPKHMRKRIKSAEGEQRKRIRLPRD